MILLVVFFKVFRIEEAFSNRLLRYEYRLFSSENIGRTKIWTIFLQLDLAFVVHVYHGTQAKPFRTRSTLLTDITYLLITEVVRLSALSFYHSLSPSQTLLVENDKCGWKIVKFVLKNVDWQCLKSEWNQSHNQVASLSCLFCICAIQTVKCAYLAPHPTNKEMMHFVSIVACHEGLSDGGRQRRRRLRPDTQSVALGRLSIKLFTRTLPSRSGTCCPLEIDRFQGQHKPPF